MPVPVPAWLHLPTSCPVRCRHPPTPPPRPAPPQGDSTQRYVKDLDVVLGRERCVLILDDTEGVWPRHRDNLVQIERYLYFPADAARFGFRWGWGVAGQGCV